MRIQAFFAVIFSVSCLTPQTFASTSCETLTATEVNQFMQTSNEVEKWRGLVSVSSALSATQNAVPFTQTPPLPVYAITADSLQNYATQGNWKAALTQTDTWYASIPNMTTYQLLEVQCANDTLSIIGTVGSRIVAQLGALISQTQFAEKESLVVQIPASQRTFLVVNEEANALVYPIIEYSGQYNVLKPVNNQNAYAISEVLLIIATEFLKTANVATLSSDLHINIPKASYFEPTASGSGATTFSVDLQYVPNSENKLLFEISKYQLLQ